MAHKDWIEPIRQLLDHPQISGNPGMMRDAAKTLLKEVDRLRTILEAHNIEYDENKIQKAILDELTAISQEIGGYE